MPDLISPENCLALLRLRLLLTQIAIEAAAPQPQQISRGGATVTVHRDSGGRFASSDVQGLLDVRDSVTDAIDEIDNLTRRIKATQEAKTLPASVREDLQKEMSQSIKGLIKQVEEDAKSIGKTKVDVSNISKDNEGRIQRLRVLQEKVDAEIDILTDLSDAIDQVQENDSLKPAAKKQLQKTLQAAIDRSSKQYKKDARLQRLMERKVSIELFKEGAFNAIATPVKLIDQGIKNFDRQTQYNLGLIKQGTDTAVNVAKEAAPKGWNLATGAYASATGLATALSTMVVGSIFKSGQALGEYVNKETGLTPEKMQELYVKSFTDKVGEFFEGVSGQPAQSSTKTETKIESAAGLDMPDFEDLPKFLPKLKEILKTSEVDEDLLFRVLSSPDALDYIFANLQKLIY